MLQTQLDKTKKEWEEKCELLKSVKIRYEFENFIPNYLIPAISPCYQSNQSLEIQLAQLQLEVTTLEKSQLEFEEYKKKIEASSR